MNAKMGKRQISKNTTMNKQDIEDLKKDTKEERARMGQVIMFNNIITSHLEFSKNKQKVGTNVNVWKREEKSLEKAQIDTNLFQNIKDTNAGLKSAERDNSVLEIGILDTLLGN
jgi:mannose/fructose/N-acetylgalactosamine-specific phosphotransferase system component IIB